VITVISVGISVFGAYEGIFTRLGPNCVARKSVRSI